LCPSARITSQIATADESTKGADVTMSFPVEPSAAIDKATVKEGYDTLMSRVYEFITCWFLGPLIARSHTTLLRALGDSKPSRLLDLGCGTGTLLRLVGEGHPDLMVGLDFSIEMLERASRKIERAGQKEASEFVLGDVEAMPFRDSSFGASTCTGTLRFLPNPALAMHETFRILKEDGHLGVREMAGGDEPRRIRHIPLPFKSSFVVWRLLPDRTLELLLRAAGFEGVSSFRGGSVPQFVIAMGPPLRKYVFFFGTKPVSQPSEEPITEPLAISDCGLQA